MKNIWNIRIGSIIFFIISAFFVSCNEEDNTLAPYAGSPMLSNIIVEDESFNPKVTWVGGNVSVFGVNRGDKAALDSSLVWLIRTEGNNILFPVVFGELPAGAQDITSQFGGTTLSELEEDEEYTFWVMKSEVWELVSTNIFKPLIVDPSVTSVSVSDTSVSITPFSFVVGHKSVNVYINIVNVRVLGAIADIFVESTTANIPLIRWRIRAAGADTLVAAIGLVRGQVYDASSALWEMYSVRDSAGVSLYARDNIIASPILVGDDVPGTRTFVEFVPENFQRNTEYHIWIATNNWDREGRQRFTQGYGYAIFFVE
jgi:hypothetical protein